MRVRVLWLVALIACAGGDRLYGQHAPARFAPLQPVPAAYSHQHIQPLTTSSALFAANGGMPRWVKWGLVGAAGGAIALPLLAGMSVDSDSDPFIQNAALGAAFGFVVVGGSVAIWDALCGGDTWSRRSGLC
jgi:hypothetical protein